MHLSDQKPLHDYLTSGLGTLYCAVNHEILRAAAMHNWSSGLSGGWGSGLLMGLKSHYRQVATIRPLAKALNSLPTENHSIVAGPKWPDIKGGGLRIRVKTHSCKVHYYNRNDGPHQKYITTRKGQKKHTHAKYKFLGIYMSLQSSILCAHRQI